MASSPTSSRQRTKPPSFPRDRQPPQLKPSEQENTSPQSTPLAGYHSQLNNYYRRGPPPTPTSAAGYQNGELDAWRIHTLQTSNPATPLTNGPWRGSKGPQRTGSPSPSMEHSGRGPWDHFSPRQGPTSSPAFYRRQSVTSNTSSAELPQRVHSRTPSPRRCVNGEYGKRPPLSGRKLTGSTNGSTSPCALETALVNSRRRIPYAVGQEPLARVAPDEYHSKLEDKDERCLSVDIVELYHVFIPGKGG
jgi:hypothetical protein